SSPSRRPTTTRAPSGTRWSNKAASNEPAKGNTNSHGPSDDDTIVAIIRPTGDNQNMSMSQNYFFETALSLPQAERADLAFLLLQSLDHLGEEVISADFGSELRERVEAYRRGEIGSSSLEEARAIIQQRQYANGLS